MNKFLIALGTLAFTFAHAEPVTFSCPEKIIASSTTQSVAPGWEAFGMENQSHRSSRAFISSGQPKDHAQLKPWNSDASYSYRKKHKKEGIIYRLEGESPNGYWLQCTYDDTTATFSKRLPDGLKMCELKTPKGPVTCK